METPQVLLEHHLMALRLPTLPARVRQGGAAVRRRRGGLSPLLAAVVGARTAGPGAAGDGAAHSAGAVPGREEPGQFRLSGDSVAEQGAGSGAGPQ